MVAFNDLTLRAMSQCGVLINQANLKSLHCHRGEGASVWPVRHSTHRGLKKHPNESENDIHFLCHFDDRVCGSETLHFILSSKQLLLGTLCIL